MTWYKSTFCKSIPTIAHNVCKILDNFIYENILDRTKCKGICTECIQCLAVIDDTHCTYYSQVSACVKISESCTEPGLRNLEPVANVVNFIKTRSLKSRFFKKNM